MLLRWNYWESRFLLPTNHKCRAWWYNGHNEGTGHEAFIGSFLWITFNQNIMSLVSVCVCETVAVW